MKNVSRRGFLGLGTSVLGGLGIAAHVKAETDYEPGEGFKTTLRKDDGASFNPGVPLLPPKDQPDRLRIYRREAKTGRLLYITSCPDAKIAETLLFVQDEYGAGNYVVVGPTGRVHQEVIGQHKPPTHQDLYQFVNRNIRYKHLSDEEHEKLRQQFLDTYPTLRDLYDEQLRKG